MKIASNVDQIPKALVRLCARVGHTNSSKIHIKKQLEHSLSDTEVIKLDKIIVSYNGPQSNVLHLEQTSIYVVSKRCLGPRLDFF